MEAGEADHPLIVVAPDSLKGSCSAPEAAAALARGIRSVFGERVRVREIPMADGGEGTLDALTAAWKGRILTVPTTDALGRARIGRVGISPDGATAIVEAAEANGLPLVADLPPQPLDADSAGVGALVRAALDAGAREILLCIGGSATNDGGAGLLRSLGVRLLDAAGAEVPPGAHGLLELDRVDLSGLDPVAREARWRIAVDVENPLVGPRGAAAVFGPQKGASSEQVPLIDAALTRLAEALASAVSSGARSGIAGARSGTATAADLQTRPGLGAAGGLAVGPVALFDAETVPGAELVAQAVDLDAAVAEARLVMTGEGRLDAQSLDGKVVSRVVAAAAERVPVIVVAGSLALTAEACRDAGITAAVSLADGPATLADLAARTPELLAETAAHLCRLFDLRSGFSGERSAL
ncbi:glycerate kinase [Leucobacter sp. GX24907]